MSVGWLSVKFSNQIIPSELVGLVLVPMPHCFPSLPLGRSGCVFRIIVTDRFGIVTAEFGNVTDHFGDVTEAVLVAA